MSTLKTILISLLIFNANFILSMEPTATPDTTIKPADSLTTEPSTLVIRTASALAATTKRDSDYISSSRFGSESRTIRSWVRSPSPCITNYYSSADSGYTRNSPFFR